MDDGLAAAEDKEELNYFLSELKKEFRMTTKDATFFLGLDITQENGNIRIGQEAFAKKILERFRFSECKPTSTPMIRDVSTTDSGKVVEFPYRKAVGALMYLMLGTRPDLAYTVGFLSRSLENPTSQDVVRLKRVLRYIAGSSNKGIVYGRNYPNSLECYSDADYAGCMETGRSTSGVLVKYAGGAISWKSQRQPSVSTSTTEAEIVAASEATKEVIWLQRLFCEAADLRKVPVLQVDNSAAVKLAMNPQFHNRVKHVAVRHFFVREKVSNGELYVTHVDTQDQIADILTKPLGGPRHRSLCESMGLK